MATYRKMSEEVWQMPLQIPQKKNNDGYSYFSNLDDLLEPHVYMGKVEKIGDQRSIIDYLEFHKKD